MPTPAVKPSYENIVQIERPSNTPPCDYVKKEKYSFVQTEFKNQVHEVDIYDNRIVPVNSQEEFPNYLDKIKKKILDSKQILSLRDNWDDNGAICINPIIFKRATNFLENYTISIYDVCKKGLTPPDINPVNDGSIDLEWNLENSSFLINFKNIKEEIAFYYGEFKDEDNVVFDTNGQINTNIVNDKFAAYLSYLSEEVDT